DQSRIPTHHEKRKLLISNLALSLPFPLSLPPRNILNPHSTSAHIVKNGTGTGNWTTLPPSAYQVSEIPQALSPFHQSGRQPGTRGHQKMAGLNV
ncbi:hypothetical protein BC938DRAFT_471815, partial [Jimgerdemannia flammicorona]